MFPFPFCLCKQIATLLAYREPGALGKLWFRRPFPAHRSLFIIGLCNLRERAFLSLRPIKSNKKEQRSHICFPKFQRSFMLHAGDGYNTPLCLSFCFCNIFYWLQMHTFSTLAAPRTGGKWLKNFQWYSRIRSLHILIWWWMEKFRSFLKSSGTMALLSVMWFEMNKNISDFLFKHRRKC